MNKKTGCGIRDARGSERDTAGFKLGIFPRLLSVLKAEHRTPNTEHRTLNTLSLLALLLLAAFAPQAEAAAPTFTLLGLGPDELGSYATGVSSNGAVVVGTYNDLYNSIPFRWTNGATELVALDAALVGTANAVSADGTVVVGYDSSVGYYPYPYRWTNSESGGGVEHLEDTGEDGEAYDVSADGSVAVGYFNLNFAETLAYRWTGTIGESLTNVSSYAYGVSADGSVVVGYAGDYPDSEAFEAFRWTSSGMQGLGRLDGADSSYANAVSADGLVVVGYCVFPSEPQTSKAFRWTQADGMKDLGPFYFNGAEYDSTTATGVSGDGSVVVGSASRTDTWVNRTFIVYNNEMCDLQSLLEANGVDFGDWSLTTALKTAISSNGQYIVGTCYDAGYKTQAYLIDLGDQPLTIPAQPPFIRNEDVADVATNSARFNGTLASTGTAACAVAVLWDTQDHGPQWDGWANTNWFNGGAVNTDWTNNTPFSTNITAAADGLLPDQTYYYRYAATNATTNAVANTVKYFITGEVKVEATDGYVKYPDRGEFRIYRPDGCTNMDITVNFTLDGTAENGTDYEYVSDSVLLAAGSTQEVVTIIPNADFDPADESVVLTLTDGSGLLYPIGTPPADSATVTIGFLTDADVRTQYVKRDNSTPKSPYTNWVDAATNIQDAIDVANPLTREVLVTNGVYDTGGAVVSEAGSTTNRVALNKAILVRSVNGPDVTIIKGGTATRCVYVAAGATLSGFTLTNGTATGESGGGAWCDTSGVLTNCIITGNQADHGGGVYQGTLNHCTLTGNSATYYGGGVKDCTLTNCTLSGNTAKAGGGASGGTLYNCTLNNNVGRNNTGNRSPPGSGGGAWNATLWNCTISSNKAEDTTNGGAAEGGGVAYGTLYNCALFGNRVEVSPPLPAQGGTLTYARGGGASEATLLNCTIANNMVSNRSSVVTNDTAGGGVYGSTLTNCIVYYNTVVNGVSNNYAGGTLQYSCTTPDPGAGTGNIADEPLFMDAEASDYKLQPGSPCIDKGTNQEWMDSVKDLAGNARIASGTVDMGAYETAEASGTLFMLR